MIADGASTTTDCLVIEYPCWLANYNESRCANHPGSCWWGQDEVCYETCYNTDTTCGNQVPRFSDGRCNYEGGRLCTRDASECVNIGLNKPGVEPC